MKDGIMPRHCGLTDITHQPHVILLCGNTHVADLADLANVVDQTSAATFRVHNNDK